MSKFENLKSLAITELKEEETAVINGGSYRPARLPRYCFYRGDELICFY